MRLRSAAFVCWLFISTLAAFAGAINPCQKDIDSARHSSGSVFCVVFAVDDSGKLVIVPEQSLSWLNSTYDSMSATQKERLTNQWNESISTALEKQQPLYWYILTDDERAKLAAGDLPQATTEAIAKLLKSPHDDWSSARKAYVPFALCTEDHHRPCNRRGPDQALSFDFNLVMDVDFLNEVPLSNQTSQPSVTSAFAHFSVVSLIKDFKNEVSIEVKQAQSGQQPTSNPISASWVNRWLESEQAGKPWVASDVRQRFGIALSALGLQANVEASPAGSPPKLTIDEDLIHIIRMPGDLDPSKAAAALEVLKILSVLLPQEDYSSVPKSEKDLPTKVKPTADGKFQDLDLADLRGKKGLAYLDIFQFPLQQAALQEIGYVVSTQEEPALDSTHTTTLILNVARPTESSESTSKAPSAPEPRTKTGLASRNPVTAAKGAQALPPLSGKPVIPVKADATPPPISIRRQVPHMKYGAGLQYRSGQAIRPILSVSSDSFQVPWGATSFQATGGTENTNGVGALDWQNDYIGFGKLHHRLSFSLAGKTDSTAKRLLGSSAETDQRTTGGQGRLEYDPANNWHGVYVQLFGQGAREYFTFSKGGTNLPDVSLWTADAGATIDVLRDARPWPGRFEFTPQVHFGIPTATVSKTYAVFSLDAVGHQRISDFKLMSADISGHFRTATQGTPIFELPTLGGGDSLRGFRPDDVLARRYWSLQNELWMPVLGTLSASPNAKGAGSVRWFLRQNIRLALFGDVAGAYEIPVAGIATGVRWAPGLGIRYVQGNFALKLDWGYGQGNGQSGPGHGRTDLGVAQTGAF